MKKVVSLALIFTIILSCFSLVTFASEPVATVYFETDKDSYEPGDFMKLTINIDNVVSPASEVFFHFSYNSKLVDLVTSENLAVDDDLYYGLYDTFGVEEAYKLSLGASFSGSPAEEIPGEYQIELVSSAAAAPAIGGTIRNETVRKNPLLYTLYFQVKDNVEGYNELRFSWIKNSGAYKSRVGYDVEGKLTYHNIAFDDYTVEINGTPIANDTTNLSAPIVCLTKTPLGNIEINGTNVNITTPSAVVFGKIAPRKTNVKRIKAGFLLSKTNVNLNVNNLSAKNFEALNISSDNIFGGLFYGPGLVEGETYYVMPYVTYEDGNTLYAENAQVFTVE